MEEIPFANEFDRALKGFIKGNAKRAASEIGSSIKRMLAGGTEPFFRREMGERHLSHSIISYGFFLWLITACISGYTGTLIGALLQGMGLYTLGRLLGSGVIAFLVSAAVCAAFMYYCNENLKCIREFRTQRKAYHSKSRGKPRWGSLAQDLKIRIGASVFLILFAPVTGIAFVISLFVTANLVAEQEATVRSAYLDALDSQIEGEFLQGALLGEFPTEITYLYKKLPENMDPGMREDIAAAFVGKKVKILAQAPKPKELAGGLAIQS